MALRALPTRACAPRRLRAAPRCCASSSPLPRGRVAIVGAGIAGVAAALALRRHGYDAVVFEAKRAADCPHAGITLSSAALAALRRIDAAVADSVIAAGDVISSVVLRDLSGRPLAENKRTGGGTGHEEPTLCVRWNELWQLLADALPADALQFGHALEDVTDACATLGQPGPHGGVASSASAAEPVLAVFSQRETFGQAAVPAAALIGADGVRSRVRTILYGSEAPPCDAGATVWRGVVDSRDVPPGLCPLGAIVHSHAPDGRTLTLLSLGTGDGALHDGALSWVASLPGEIPLGVAAPGNLAAAFVDLKQHASAEARTMAHLVQAPFTPLAEASAAPLVADRVAAAFADFSDLAPVLAATPVGEIVERRLFYRASQDDDEDDAAMLRSCRGVVSLIGDAASMRLPSLGLGACLSLESAAALGDALGAVPVGAGSGAVAAALRRFESGQQQRARQAARAALEEARRVAAAPNAAIPTPGAAFQGWLLGNARRGQAS